METVLRPTYRQLFEREGYPQGSSWGLWGDDDQIGALNLVTPEKVQAAARLVKRGAVFPLGWTGTWTVHETLRKVFTVFRP